MSASLATGRAHIMHATPDDPSTCSSPHVDGCPGCVVNTEEPIALDRHATGCGATYRCTDCGHQWDTAWGCN